MITVMDSINNHFVKSTEKKQVEFTADSIKFDFTETYLVGMYVIVTDSYLNDGIYKIASVSDGVIEVEEPLSVEKTDKDVTIYASAPPQAFVGLVSEIKAFGHDKLGVASESIDDYSVSYTGDGSWQSVFKSRLNQYRKVYPDIPTTITNSRWQDRW